MTEIDSDLLEERWSQDELNNVVRSCLASDNKYTESFADIARMAAKTCGAPMALIALREGRGISRAATVGFSPEKGPSGPSVIEEFIDAELRGTGLDIGKPPFPSSLREADIEAACGVPLRTRSGHAIGSLYVFDRVAREFTEAQLDILDFLARQTMNLLETGRSAARQARAVTEAQVADLKKRKFEWLVTQSPDFVGMIDAVGQIVFLNSPARQMVGLRPDAPAAYDLEDVIAAADLETYRQEVKPMIARGEPCERRLRMTRVGSEIPLQTLFSIFPLRDDEGRIVGYGLRSKDVADQEAEEQRRNNLITEGQHRVKNMITLVSAIVTQTIRGAASLEDAGRSARSRLTALGEAQTILGSAASATIDDVVGGAIRALDFGRIDKSGPALNLVPEQVQGLSLFLYELATNAVKYGSLSNDTGRVSVSWFVTERGTLVFKWTETGGPAVDVPEARGAGSTLLGRIVATYFNGEVEHEFLPQGVQAILRGRLTPQ